MKLLGQIAIFAGVGSCATVAHICVAWALMELSILEPYVANLTGACAAYFVSFVGNAVFTFGVRQRLPFYAVRYLAVSAASLVLTTLEVALVNRLAWPSYAYAAIVLLTVPPTTFLIAKLWAFAPRPARIDCGTGRSGESVVL